MVSIFSVDENRIGACVPLEISYFPRSKKCLVSWKNSVITRFSAESLHNGILRFFETLASTFASDQFMLNVLRIFDSCIIWNCRRPIFKSDMLMWEEALGGINCSRPVAEISVTDTAYRIGYKEYGETYINEKGIERNALLCQKDVLDMLFGILSFIESPVDRKSFIDDLEERIRSHNRQASDTCWWEGR